MPRHSTRSQASARWAAFNPPEIFVIEDDFDAAGYVAANAATKFSETADGGEWLVTNIDGGTDNGETIVVGDDNHGGVLVITTNDANNDATSIQLNGESIALSAGRRIHYSTRVKIGDVSTTDWAFGLAVADTDILGGVTDALMFRCPDATGDIDTVAEKDSTETAADSTVDAADDTFQKFEIIIVGTTTATFMIDGVVVANVTTNLPDDEAMSPFFTVRNASAAASVMSIDFIKVTADR